MGGYKAYWAKKKAVSKPKDSLIAVEVKVYLCPKVHEILKKLQDGDDGLPISRYVQIALDNEMDQEKPFHYPLTFQDEPYVEEKYSHEANLIFDFLRQYSHKGISLMMLMMLRRRVGILEREKIYRGYVELLNSGMVEEFYPKIDRFVFPKWYRKIRIKERVTR